jgi:uncharacterized protein YecE (DUF72 family)
MRAFIGTSGYSYAEWKGSFYPAKLPGNQMLAHYAQTFRTVEINNTFYRMPTTQLLETWCERVPDGFSFVLKAPRRITHSGRLDPEKVGDAVAHLFGQAEVLGDKLGPVLFQLPPFLKIDVERLREFLALVPEGRRAALEFRHPSWLAEPVFVLLREADAALCQGDGGKLGEVSFEPTASWGYLRLRSERYDDAALDRWTEKVNGQGWSDVYAFFKHEQDAPELASRFTGLLSGHPTGEGVQKP